MKRILHVQVTGEPTVEELTNVGNAFAAAISGDETKVVTTPSNVQAYNVEITDETPIQGVVVAAAITVDLIALVAHEVNRGYCAGTGDTSQLAWVDAPEWQRKSAIEGVTAKLRFALTPEQQHEAWCQSKLRDGWVYGAKKDAEAKTHPCLVAYADLPAEQRVKDYLFGAVVTALAPKLPRPSPIVRPIQTLTDASIENKVGLVWRSNVAFHELTKGMVFRYPEEQKAMLAISDPYVNYHGSQALLTIDVDVASAEQPQPWTAILERVVDESVEKPAQESSMPVDEDVDEDDSTAYEGHDDNHHTPE